MDDILIRKAEKGDMPAVLDLIRELASYERAPNEVTINLEDLEKDAFGEDAVFKIILAEVDGGIVGMSFYYYSYSTWKGKCIFIEDIIVKEAFRRKGIGALLFDEMIKIAFHENAYRLHWQVLDWNEPAINFYKKYETDFDNTWINGKLSRDSIIKYIKDGQNRST